MEPERLTGILILSVGPILFVALLAFLDWLGQRQRERQERRGRLL